MNPAVRSLHPVTQPDGRLPTKLSEDHAVVRVSPVHSLRRTEIVVPPELDPSDLFGDIHQSIDADQLAGSEIDRLENFAFSNRQSAPNAIVDVHERAGLGTVAPDLDGGLSPILGVDDLATDRCR